MDEALPQEQEDEDPGMLDRRKFLRLTGNVSLLLGLGGLSAVGLDYLSPNVLLEPAAEVNVGPPDHFAPGSVTLLAEHKVFVVRSAEGTFHALSMVCTHLGCLTGYRTGANRIVCPCHGSQFNPADGSVVGGPAPRPLPNLKMTLSSRGELWVDRSIQVEPGTVLKV
jgi:cytochrome b6-f complex iron-sulfur subunit